MLAAIAVVRIEKENWNNERIQYYRGMHMLSFNFNKKKVTGVQQVHIGDRLLYEGVV